MRELKLRAPPQNVVSSKGVSDASIIAYTCDAAREKIEHGMLRYPDDPSKYRRVNQSMDSELVWYKTEIEKRFMQGELRDYIMARTAVTQPESETLNSNLTKPDGPERYLSTLDDLRNDRDHFLDHMPERPLTKV